MVPRELVPTVVVLVALYFLVVAISYWWMMRTRAGLEKKDHEMKQRLYELAILKEISDRTGYSLNVQKILDVIMGSLNQFLEYSAVAYMLLEPSKVVFKADLEKSVSSAFIKNIRERMICALTALLGRDLAGVPVEETITGAIMLETMDQSVQSYFNIPLVIGDQLVGVLTIAHTKAGLYKEEEMEILYKIVNQASHAVTKLEEVVRAEQGKMAAMLESMVEGVVMTDLDYRIVAANPAAKNLIAYDRESMPTIFDFIEAFKESFDMKGKLEEAIKLNKILTIDGIVFHNKYYQILISPVKSNTGTLKGEILGGVVIFHDITHEKEAEKMRNDFTSMMVHELRSPLGNIKKIGELMKSSKILEDKQASAEYVSMLYESSSSMLDLVNDLLDVAKLESGKFDVDKQPMNLKEVVEGRMKFFETAAQGAGVTLKLFVSEHFPSVVQADAKRITQVMNNLLSNGINYTSSGGMVTLECFVHAPGSSVDDEAVKLGVAWLPSGDFGAISRDLPASVVVAVTDTGEGISGANIEKLFNKFTQFVSSVRQPDHKGTGLGLVIVKGIVEAHGGMVGVGSKTGTGSTFYFTLPL
jgi:signal transduction histidine kinase